MKSLTNFVVGIGSDTRGFAKGRKQVLSGLDNIKSRTVQLGAAMSAAFSAKALTGGFSKATLEVTRFSQVLGLVPDSISAIGRISEKEGGSLAGVMQLLDKFDTMRRRLDPQQMAALFAESGIKGINPNVVLGAKNATDAYLRLADAMQGMSDTQRLKTKDFFGISQADYLVMIKGRKEIEKLMQSQKRMQPLTNQMASSAKRFNDEWSDLTTNLGGFANVISQEVLPPINNFLSKLNEWINTNREIISSGISEHITGIAVAFAALTAGSVISGLSSIAKSMTVIKNAAAATSAANVAGGAAKGKMGSFLGKGVGSIAIVGAAAAIASSRGEDIKAYDKIDQERIKKDPFRGLSPTMDRLEDAFGAPFGSKRSKDAWSGLFSSDESPTQQKMNYPRPQAQQKMTPAGSRFNLPPIVNNIIIDGAVVQQQVAKFDSRQNDMAIDDFETSLG